MPAKEKPLVVGQEVAVAFMYAGRRERNEIARMFVVSVGRKWAELSRSKERRLHVKSEVFVNLEEPVAGGGFRVYEDKTGNWTTRGTCYPSEQAASNAVDLEAEWKSFVEEVRAYSYSTPNHMTVERITQARELLGIPKKEA